MSVLNQLNDSKLSLQGNRFNPKSQQSDWGYSLLTPAELQPDLSELHYNRSLPSSTIRIGYSVDGASAEDILKYAEAVGLSDGSTYDGIGGGLGTGVMRVYDYNRAFYGGYNIVRPPSQLDELDTNAPKNTQTGAPLPSPLYNNTGPVVSQVYKSLRGKQYKDLGPKSGRY